MKSTNVTKRFAIFLFFVFSSIIVFKSIVKVAHADASLKTLTWEEVKAHASPQSCYVVIENIVYNMSAVLGKHEKEYGVDISKYCGRDGTKGWLEKEDKKKPHSRKSKLLLNQLVVGKILR